MKIQKLLTTTSALLLTSTILPAQTWDGGGADNNFNTALNWNANIVPVNNGTANLIFAGAVDPAPVVNVNFDVNGATFSNTAAAFTISASGGSVLTVRGGGITNNDADTQTFSTPVTFAAGSSITATSGPLNFTGQVNLGSNTVTVGGGFNTSLDAIVGTGTFVKNGTGTLSVAPVGNQNYSLTLTAGTVNYTTSVTFAGGVADISVAGGTFAPLSNLTVSSGATFDVAGTGTFIFPASRTMTVQAASTATYANFLTTAASSTYRVTGASSTFSTGGLAVRDGASVEVLSGGAFTNATGLIDFGAGGTAGTILVDGTGSVFTHTPSLAPTVGFGAGSTGMLTFNNGGTGSFANTSLVFGTGGGNGTLTVKNGAQVTAGTFEVAQSTLSGTGTVLVTGPGSKLTTTFNISDFSIGATSGGTGTVTVADGGELDLDGPLTINETGTLNLNGGIITMALTEAFTNNGTLNFNAGRISLGDNLNIGGGTSPLGTNITLQTGKEIVVPSSRTTTIGTASAVVLDGGLLSTGTLVNSGGTLDFRRGTLRLTGNAGVTIGSGGPLGSNLSLPAGTAIEIPSAGTTLTVANGASLSVDGGSLSVRLLTVNGSVLINAGTAAALDGGSIANGGQLFVARDLTLGATFTINSGGRLELANGTGRIASGATIANSGLLTGSGTIACATANNATGEIRADSGKTLYFSGGLFGGNSGELNLQGGTLDFSGAITNNAGAFITGRGALHTGGLTNNGQIAVSGGAMDIHGDTTFGAGSRIVTSGAGSVTTFFDDVVHNGTEIRTSAGCSTVFFGAVSGAGPYTGTGTVYFEGDLRPGNSPASVSYEGDLVFGGGASLTLEIGGLSEGSEYDHLSIGGTLYTDGDLVLALLDGFTPQFGDTFDLLDVGTFAGDFDSVTAPALGGGNAWDFSALKTTGSVTVVPEPGIGTLLLSALGFVGMGRARGRVARSSRALVSASRRNELPCAPDTENVFAKGAVSKVREGGTPSPTLGTSVLPGICRDALSR